jgi:hypothetical protein
MYSGVPSSMPSSVSAAAAVTRFDGRVPGASSQVRARPKSSSFTVSCAVIITFSGFRSRWTMRARCASASAPAMSRARAIARGTGSGPWRSISRTSTPRTSSMARKTRPSASPASKTVAMFGCVRPAAVRASRRKRRRRALSAVTPAGSSLSATSRWRFVSSAR